MANSVTAGGDAWDISAQFSVVASFECNEVVSAAAQMQYQLFGAGTATTGGISGATLLVGAVRSNADAGVFDEADGQDLSTTHTAALVVVIGKAA
jgi:hypothetical protein